MKYLVTNWDGSQDLCTATRLEDGKVELTYEDGVRHTVTAEAFDDMKPAPEQ